MRAGGIIGSVSDGSNLDCPFGDRTVLAGCARDRKVVKVLVTFDAETTQHKVQHRQGRQATQDDFSRHVEANG
jgi:hypothetical protein